jgi:hypothetical protein
VSNGLQAWVCRVFRGFEGFSKKIGFVYANEKSPERGTSGRPEGRMTNSPEKDERSVATSGDRGYAAGDIIVVVSFQRAKSISWPGPSNGGTPSMKVPQTIASMKSNNQVWFYVIHKNLLHSVIKINH